MEYGTPVAGQVSGGRWKPLQYFLAASSFTDVTASCGASQTFHTIGLVCYARNDLPTAQASLGRHCHSTLSLAVVDCHSLGIYEIVMLPLLSFSAKMTVSPRLAQAVRVTVELLHFATGEADVVSTTDIDLAAGAGTTAFFCADGRGLSAAKEIDLSGAPCAPVR